jgi:hypothetical protein
VAYGAGRTGLLAWLGPHGAWPRAQHVQRRGHRVVATCAAALWRGRHHQSGGGPTAEQGGEAWTYPKPWRVGGAVGRCNAVAFDGGGGLSVVTDDAALVLHHGGH